MIQQKIERIEELKKQIKEELESLVLLIEEEQEEFLDKIKKVKSYISDFSLEGVIPPSEKIEPKKQPEKIIRMGRPKGSIKYTKEHLDFVRSISHLSDIEIIEEFNKKYGTSIKPKSRQLYNLMVRKKIIFLPKRKKIKRMKVYSNIECPKCGSHDITKRGKRKIKGSEIQRYHCGDCQKRFVLEETPTEKIREDKKKEAIEFRKKGYSLREIAIEMDVTYTTIHNWTKDIKPDEKEEEDFVRNIHLDSKGRYACNSVVNPNKNRLSKDWEKITCGNCVSRFKKKALEKIIKPSVISGLTSIEDVPKEILDFIKKNLGGKNNELRDKIIEKFEINYNTKIIKSMVSSFKVKKDSVESQESEVKRIKDLRNKYEEDNEDEEDLPTLPPLEEF